MILKQYDRKLISELPELVRINVGGKRHYETPNGSYPSITTVLSIRGKEGIYACPEGAATLVALKKLIDNKDVDKDDKVILYNTGSVLKYGELIDSKERKIIKKTTTAKEIKMMMNN